MIIIAHQSGFDSSQEAITEYSVLKPMINGCSWLQMHQLTSVSNSNIEYKKNHSIFGFGRNEFSTMFI
ncbi:hypothetical protein F8388_008545 [Cannabis sativa]|uniref:Uncharacterized protein n=1 Tax=Cannabis sativa TaxID=3483 RepID=A0A7J6EHX7_CANSA|nr:hypothetical protein F8388_008545 [Cannabis sativa]